MKLVIQIPCFNEEDSLAATVADLPQELPGIDTIEYLVIDDGSTDRTVEVAEQLGVHHVVSHSHNRGLAAAFMTGIDAALRAGADVIVNTDADNQYVGDCVGDIVGPVVSGDADLVVGERPIKSIQEFSPIKKLLQRAGSWVVRKFSGTPVRDAASGFRAFSREAALRVQVFGRYSYTMETLVQAGWEGLRVTSVPIAVNPQTRPSRLVRSIPSYVIRSGSAIVRAFVLYKPFRFFFYVGALPFLFGAALLARWLVHLAIDDEYSSRLPSLLTGVGAIVVAGQIWSVGFVADILAANRRMLAELRLQRRRTILAPDPGDTGAGPGG
jgi:glycosyltransferase involved in cell wall biosynthesis